MTLDPSTLITETLVWNGRTVEVRFDPDWSSLSELGPDRQVAHLELEVTEPPRAPLPVTETGYRSHFVTAGVVENAGGPGVFVRAWLDEEARKPAWRRVEVAWRQLDLFG